MTAALEVDRAQVLAYRVAAQQFDRSVTDPAALDVLALGLQDTPYGSARVAVAARTTAPPGPALELVWATRGAPHLHRAADLPGLAAALWPRGDADATARIANVRIAEGAALGLAAFTAAAEAMHAVVRSSLAKGEVSTAVSARVPASLTYDCPSCRARHIFGSLFQQVGLAAGVRVAAVGGGTVLSPIAGWPGVPAAPGDPAPLVAAYLRLLGPATPADVAKLVGTSVSELRPAWPAGLAEVRVDGRRAWLPADRVDALRAAPAPELVRLLPPRDPYLQARDRELIVPGRDRQKAVWPALGNPGALLAGAEVAGTWRAKAAGRRAVEVTVTPFGPLSPRVRAAVEAEAGHLAAARGAAEARVRVEG